MDQYIGKICPYCKSVLTAKDDIVVCSICEMPHHKDCWVENQGCTTFGCTGTIQTPSAGASGTPLELDDFPSPAGFVSCPRCRRRNALSSAFCSECGSPLRPPAAPRPQGQPQPIQPRPVQPQPVQPQPVQPPIQPRPAQPQLGVQPQPVQPRPAQPQLGVQPRPVQPRPVQPQPVQPPIQPRPAQPQPVQPRPQNAGYTPYGAPQGGYPPPQPPQAPAAYSALADIDPDAALYVGPRSEYYIPRFRMFKARNSKASWNWFAFFFTPFWMMYRKMYALGGIVLGGVFLLSLLNLSLSPTTQLFFTMLLQGGYVIFGILGDRIYMTQIEKKIAQGKTMDEYQKSQFIASAGGVSVTALVCSAVGYTLAILVFLAM